MPILHPSSFPSPFQLHAHLPLNLTLTLALTLQYGPSHLLPQSISPNRQGFVSKVVKNECERECECECAQWKHNCSIRTMVRLSRPMKHGLPCPRVLWASMPRSQIPAECMSMASLLLTPWTGEPRAYYPWTTLRPLKPWRVSVPVTPIPD